MEEAKPTDATAKVVTRTTTVEEQCGDMQPRIRRVTSFYRTSSNWDNKAPFVFPPRCSQPNT